MASDKADEMITLRQHQYMQQDARVLTLTDHHPYDTFAEMCCTIKATKHSNTSS